MQWSSVIGICVVLSISGVKVLGKYTKGLPCASFSGADGTCRQSKYCWVSHENPQPPVSYCPGQLEGNSLVCCPDERPLRPIEQRCVDFSHIANRIPPTTSTTSTTTVSYSTTSSEEEENQRQESEESAEIKPRSWRIQSHLVRIALGPVDQMRFKCTGTIISDRYVLTSAVCTESPTGRAKHVWLGDYPYHQTDPHQRKSLLIPVKERILYKNYNQTYLFHDVGLLHLKRQIHFNFYIRPACVNVDEEFDLTSVVATEWDHQQEGIQILDHQSCNAHFVIREILDSEQFCVKLKNNCKFSTGSPLQVKHPFVEGSQMIVGLLTFRKDCLKGESIVAYTRISEFASWIESIVFR